MCRPRTARACGVESTRAGYSWFSALRCGPRACGVTAGAKCARGRQERALSRPVYAARARQQPTFFCDGHLSAMGLAITPSSQMRVGAEAHSPPWGWQSRPHGKSELAMAMRRSRSATRGWRIHVRSLFTQILVGESTLVRCLPKSELATPVSFATSVRCLPESHFFWRPRLSRSPSRRRRRNF